MEVIEKSFDNEEDLFSSPRKRGNEADNRMDEPMNTNGHKWSLNMESVGKMTFTKEKVLQEKRKDLKNGEKSGAVKKKKFL